MITIQKPDKDQFKIDPISEQANSYEIKVASAQLFDRFQSVAYNLVRAEQEVDRLESQVERRRSEILVDTANEELTKSRRTDRLTAEEKREKAEAQLNPLKKELAEARSVAGAWKQVMWMLRYLADRVDTMAMVTASDKKFTGHTPSVQIREPIIEDATVDEEVTL